MRSPGDPARPERLAGAERRTYEALRRHPAPDDLLWGDVRALLAALADLQEGRKGLLKVTRRGVMTTLRAGRDRQPLSADEILEVRSFLERSSEGVSMPVVAEGTELCVALDAEGARLYRVEFHAGRPRRLEPFHESGYPAHLRFSLAPATDRPQPLRLGFYKELSRALRDVERILLVACGEHGVRAVEALRTELGRGRADLSLRVLGVLALRGERASEEQLLRRVQEFHAAPPGGQAREP